MLYDLEGRTEKFSASVIKFCYSVKQDVLSRPLVTQLIRSGTSIGANYMEANQAASKKDFRNKIKICQKEASETRYWLKLLSPIKGVDIEECRRLWKESNEFVLIFGKIAGSSN